MNSILRNLLFVEYVSMNEYETESGLSSGPHLSETSNYSGLSFLKEVQLCCKEFEPRSHAVSASDDYLLGEQCSQDSENASATEGWGQISEA